MLAERTEEFINGLCVKTKAGKVEWKPLRICKEWKRFAEELNQENEKLADFGIDLDNSYFFSKVGGYVFLLEAHYGNKSLFSPAMDKYVLTVKINAMIPFQYLCDSENAEWKPLLEELFQCIFQNDVYAMPDALYNFMDKVLEE